MLADFGYDSQELKTKLIEIKYEPIIYPNNRNNKIKKTLGNEYKIIYKNRMISTGYTNDKYITFYIGIKYLNLR